MGDPVDTERWLPVDGWEGFYEVSDMGRVRSLPRVVVKIDGRRCPVGGGALAEEVTRRGGYRRVTLRAPGRSRKVLVHNLVLEAFVGPRPAGAECRHLDGSTGHNHLANLAWGSPSENLADRMIHNKSGWHISPETAAVVAADLAAGMSGAEAARRHGISKSQACRIRARVVLLDAVEGRLVERVGVDRG